MWFRSDLRISDNTALNRACESASDGVIAVFALCPAQWSDHGWGSMKVDFVLRNLRILSQYLDRINIPLLLVRAPRFAAVPAKILGLAKRQRCAGLFFNQEHEVNEKRRDEQVMKLFYQAGLAVQAFTDQTILDVSRLRTGSGGWYTVFTPFKRRWLATVQQEGPPPLRAGPRKRKATGIRPDPVPESLRGFSGPARAGLWPAGEKEAHKRLRLFVSRRIDGYHMKRDLPGEPGTSELSPYLACGALSGRQCLAAAMEANDGRLDAGRKGVTTWISELIWREFYRHVLMGFPRVCMDKPFRLETDQLAWREDETQFRTWCEGRTGVPIVDAGMRQLTRTGWMHNRARMIAAMFLTKDLFIDWRWGERYFMQHLVDGDFASNNGGWQWCASTGTDAAPYFRIFNPFSQSGRYDPDGAYIRRFVPELAGLPADALHDPRGIAAPGLKYPALGLDRAACRARVLSAFKKLRRQKLTKR